MKFTMPITTITTHRAFLVSSFIRLVLCDRDAAAHPFSGAKPLWPVAFDEVEVHQRSRDTQTEMNQIAESGRHRPDVSFCSIRKGDSVRFLNLLHFDTSGNLGAECFTECPVIINPAAWDCEKHKN